MAGGRWSTQQVAGLAPDDKSMKAARGLTNPRTWSELGCTDTLVFGKCQGSGKEPYQVTVDLTEPAFRCTCPSRKFPCKHGLALLLLWVEHGDAVGEVSSAAGFADEWANQRADRAGKRAATATRAADDIVDPEAQAKRQADREAAMTAGVDELERWMADMVRQGLAGVRRQPYGFWDAMAARLVDAQVPALADRVREVGGSVAVRDDWSDHLMAELGRWELAVHAWRRRGDLSPALYGDLRAFLGWPRRPDEAAGFEQWRDDWVVAGVIQGVDGRITSQRTWLWGRDSGRWTVVLDFAAAGAALQVAGVVGSVVHDAVVVHPGSAPNRVSFSGAQQVIESDGRVPASSISEAVDQLAGALSANPWRERVAVSLRDVAVVEAAGSWWLADRNGDRLPLAASVEPWLILAHTGGQPATVVAEWEGGAVTPMTLAPTPEVVVPL